MKWLSVITLILLIFILQSQRAAALDDDAVCGSETVRAEQRHSIPNRLLQAISLVESGRWNGEQKAILAWPWTVMAEGEGRFLPSKTAAIAEVKKLQARGINNIDVGCMQINLRAHPNAFSSLEQAFDPAMNVDYAARFLNNLFIENANWSLAAAHYHSHTPELANGYKAKLISTWQRLMSQPDNRGKSIFVATQQNNPSKEKTEARQLAEAYRAKKIEEYWQNKKQSAG